MNRSTSRIVAEAAAWAAELDDGGLTPERRGDLDIWRGRDLRHGQALDRMRRLDTAFSGLDPTAGDALKRVLLRGRRRGRRKATIMMLSVAAGIVALGGLLGVRSFAVQERFADQVTATGEQRTLDLADGSKVRLDTATAADVSGRRVRLYRGQVLATVARRPGAPFVVETRHGAATALGTAFIVRADSDVMRVTVTESRVRVCTRSGVDCVLLGPGEGAEVQGAVITPMAPVSPHKAAAWASGWLEADDTPVSEVLAELSRYHARPIRFAADSLQDVRVTGSFPLTEPDRVLAALGDSAGLATRPLPDGGVEVSRRP